MSEFKIGDEVWLPTQVAEWLFGVTVAPYKIESVTPQGFFGLKHDKKNGTTIHPKMAYKTKNEAIEAAKKQLDFLKD